MGLPDECGLIRDDVEEEGEGEEGEESPVPAPESKYDMLYLVFVVCAASMTASTLGYDVGVMADAMYGMQDEFDLTTWEKGIVVGSLNFLAAVGALIGGSIADAVGRRKTLAVCSALYLIGTAAMALAPTFAVLLAGRVVTGLGVGISFVIGPIYISEITPPSVRGMLASIFDISINAGILVGYIVGFICVEVMGGAESDGGSDTSGGLSWRVMIGVGAVFPLLVAVCLVRLPESPRWLLLKKTAGEESEQKARSILLSILKDEAATDDCIRSIRAEAHGSVGWCEALSPTEGYLRHTMGVAYGLAFWQQITGSEAVLYYAGTFLDNAGMQQRDMKLLGNMLVGTAKLLPEFWVMASIDKRGRRWHLRVSAVSMTVVIGALAVSFALHLPAATVVVLLCAFMATFSAGLGPFSFITASEVIPLSHRAAGMTFVTFINRFVSGAVALSALSVADSIGEGFYFLIYAVVSLVSVRFYMKKVPETKGKSLEQIAAEMRSQENTSILRAML